MFEVYLMIYSSKFNDRLRALSLIKCASGDDVNSGFGKRETSKGTDGLLWLILLREQAEIRNLDCGLQRLGESPRLPPVGWIRRLDGARQVHLRRGHGQTIVGRPDEPVPVVWPE